MPPSPSPSIHDLHDSLLLDLYDTGAFDRGMAYAAQDRVRIIKSEPGSIRAVCRGSGRSTYIVRVRWHGARDGIYIDDECSCPIGGACKHCVAAVVTARREAAPPKPVPAGESRLTLAPPPPDWRRQLSELDLLEQPTQHTPLALEIVLQAPPRTRYGQHRSEQVTIRPMRAGSTGRWVKSGATWQELVSGYRSPSLSFDPTHVAAVRSLATSGRVGYYGGANATITLDQFGPDLWHHLRHAAHVGIALIGEDPSITVELVPEDAKPEIDMTALPDGSIELRADLVAGGESMLAFPGRSGGIGGPVHGMWLTDDHVLRLVPFAAPLHPSVARLLDSGPLVVPPVDVDDLLDRYHPALARHATVGSSDASVTIEETHFHSLLLTIERTALDAAELRWSARYRRGKRVTDHPLGRFTGGSRDIAAEMEAVDLLELPTHLVPDLVRADGLPRDLGVAGRDFVVLLTEAVPEIEATGLVEVEVQVHSELPALRHATDDPLISLAVTDSGPRRDGNDWFDLQVIVSVDGEEIPFVDLFTALHRGDEILILASGTWLRLDRPEFDKMRELLDEARGLAEPATDGSAARLNAFQTGWWDELAKLGVVAEQSERWSRNVSTLR